MFLILLFFRVFIIYFHIYALQVNIKLSLILTFRSSDETCKYKGLVLFYTYLNTLLKQ